MDKARTNSRLLGRPFDGLVQLDTSCAIREVDEVVRSSQLNLVTSNAGFRREFPYTVLGVSKIRPLAFLCDESWFRPVQETIQVSKMSKKRGIK